MNDADAASYVKWLRDLSAGNFARAQKVPTATERAEQLELFNASPSDLVLGIETKKTPKLVGTIALRDIDWVKSLAEASIFIGDKKERNKGYGTEAMKLLLEIGIKQLHLRKIRLRVKPQNQIARHVFEKVGFRTENASKRFVVMVTESSAL